MNVFIMAIQINTVVIQPGQLRRMEHLFRKLPGQLKTAEHLIKNCQIHLGQGRCISGQCFLIFSVGQIEVHA